MEEKIEQLLNEFPDKIKNAKTLKDCDMLFLELYGKKGHLTLLTREFRNLDKNLLQRIRPKFLSVKNLEIDLNKRKEEIREEGYRKLESEKLDLEEIASPASPDRNDGRRKGHLHPTTIFMQEIVELFKKLGFQQYDAPQIDTDYNNFEVLNIPPEHPARDLWDTLYINSKFEIRNSKLLLRTHTSNSQIHIMREFKPPIRMMVLGRCFRYENLDPRHEHTFDQFELVYIDKGLSMANLQFLSEYFLKHMFGQEIKVRLQPGYYPFTEPSAKILGECIFCKGSGCKICGGVGWLELAGAGMIHPKVLENGGVDPNIYSGIAWGVGPARMAMLKWGIEDIREFLKGDLKFLQKF
ncbi:phenylalanine--tRNA ligase subunit alpha [Candidatus Daviesbacteria bacterium]|nr:phenylalanine--tRNA ligase subunit alpha [Candidatus Daviesbacteria bacterium]